MSISQPWAIKHETVTRVAVESDPSLGYNPNKRPIDQHLRFGIVNLDKPPGPSSHEVVAWIKKMLNVKHAGHGGTLEADSWPG
ncbi:MAG: tRNA pseudouridine synthase A [archaeon]